MGYRLFCICVLCILGAVSLARQQCVRETKSSELAAAVAHSSLSVEDHQAQCLLLLAGTSGHLISSLPDGGNSASPGSATTVELKPNVCYLEGNYFSYNMLKFVKKILCSATTTCAGVQLPQISNTPHDKQRA